MIGGGHPCSLSGWDLEHWATPKELTFKELPIGNILILALLGGLLGDTEELLGPSLASLPCITIMELSHIVPLFVVLLQLSQQLDTLLCAVGPQVLGAWSPSPSREEPL